MRFWLIILLLFIIVACDRRNGKVESDLNNFFEVDIERDINSTKQLKISSISDSIEYIAFETNPDCLLGELTDIIIDRNRIIVLSEGNKKEIFVFARDGKFLNKVGEKGRAPKEYYDIIDFVSVGNEIIIVDYSQRLTQYSISGEFERYIGLPKQASRIMVLGDSLFACYIPDNFFGKEEGIYNWLITDFNGNSIGTIKTSFFRDLDEEKLIKNHYVLTNFSSQYLSSFKEAFSDTLYYIDGTTFNINPIGFLNLGIHKIDYSKTFDEVVIAEHNMRINRLIDFKNYLFVYYACMCRENDKTHLGVYDKKKDEFFTLADDRLEEKIINNMGGPNFKPLTCNKDNQLFGYVNAYECLEIPDLVKKYNIKESDNPVLIVANLKNE